MCLSPCWCFPPSCTKWLIPQPGQRSAKFFYANKTIGGKLMIWRWEFQHPTFDLSQSFAQSACELKHRNGAGADPTPAATHSSNNVCHECRKRGMDGSYDGPNVWQWRLRTRRVPDICFQYVFWWCLCMFVMMDVDFWWYFVCGLKSCGAVQVLQQGIASRMHAIMKLLMDCAQPEEWRLELSNCVCRKTLKGIQLFVHCSFPSGYCSKLVHQG